MKDVEKNNSDLKEEESSSIKFKVSFEEDVDEDKEHLAEISNGSTNGTDTQELHTQDLDDYEETDSQYTEAEDEHNEKFINHLDHLASLKKEQESKKTKTLKFVLGGLIIFILVALALFFLISKKGKDEANSSTASTEISVSEESTEDSIVLPDGFTEYNENVWASSDVLIYKSTDLESEPVGAYAYGTAFSLIGKSNDFYLINFNGDFAYVTIDNIVFNNPEESVADNKEDSTDDENKDNSSKSTESSKSNNNNSATSTATVEEAGANDSSFSQEETNTSTEAVVPKDVEFEFFDPANQ